MWCWVLAVLDFLVCGLDGGMDKAAGCGGGMTELVLWLLHAQGDMYPCLSSLPVCLCPTLFNVSGLNRPL